MQDAGPACHWCIPVGTVPSGCGTLRALPPVLPQRSMTGLHVPTAGGVGMAADRDDDTRAAAPGGHGTGSRDAVWR